MSWRWIVFHCYYFLLYKVQCFIRISGTDKTDNLTCEIIYDNFTCENHRFSNNHQSWLLDILYWWKTCSLYNKQKNTWVLRNTSCWTRYFSLVHCAQSWDIMFNTRNKSGISAHPCIILYIKLLLNNFLGRIASFMYLRGSVRHVCYKYSVLCNA